MVVIVNENKKLASKDGFLLLAFLAWTAVALIGHGFRRQNMSILDPSAGRSKGSYRARHSKGWSRHRGTGHEQDTYHGKTLLHSCATELP